MAAGAAAGAAGTIPVLHTTSHHGFVETRRANVSPSQAVADAFAASSGERAGAGSGPKVGQSHQCQGRRHLADLYTSSQLCKYHRLRAPVPSKLWRWKVIAGWTWTGGNEHINSLELRAVLTAVKWRIQRQGHLACRLVALHSLSRGRSSSRKLRRAISKVNALLLASSSQVLWGYIHTDQNPADKPSRWGRRVRTKYRNA